MRSGEETNATSSAITNPQSEMARFLLSYGLDCLAVLTDATTIAVSSSASLHNSATAALSLSPDSASNSSQ